MVLFLKESTYALTLAFWAQKAALRYYFRHEYDLIYLKCVSLVVPTPIQTLLKLYEQIYEQILMIECYLRQNKRFL